MAVVPHRQCVQHDGVSEHLKDYLYFLPPDRIADRPPEQRENSRMLVLEKGGGCIAHRSFTDLPAFLQPGDLLVLNDSRVIPARLHDDSGKIELLLLEQRAPAIWTAMGRPGKKLRIGARITIAGTTATVRGVMEDGLRVIEFAAPPDLDRHGEMPIPPYFHRPADERDRERYQTVFARDPGSVAAPTAGLHFTPEILRTINHAFVTLHVGSGTFQPVKHEDLSLHRMHAERYTIPAETALKINRAKAHGGRIIAVGTTTTRVLESQPPGPISACEGSTDIFIRPPYSFGRIDGLLTNFHLPGSTLLMLVSALAGREKILGAYAEAVSLKYRFFSYGDCMLIL
jgi:S-adenosylmethionine:tRNA ribosyltransferase-isomerase